MGGVGDLDPLDDGEKLFEAIGQPQQECGTAISSHEQHRNPNAADVVIFKGGEAVMRHQGAAPKGTLLDAIRGAL